MYFVFRDLYPMMRHVCSFSYDDRVLALYVNKRQLIIPEENYENAKLAFIHVIAGGGHLIHEKVLCDPNVANHTYDVVGESIQAFIDHKKRAG